MENEIMTYENEGMETEVAPEAETEKTGMSTGGAMLLGAGLTLAFGAIVKLSKKVIAKAKAKKAAKEAADEHDYVDVSEEDVENVTRE